MPRRSAFPVLRLARAAIALALLLAPRTATAREVTVPLTLDAELLRQALLAQVFDGPGQTARVWDDGSGCNELVLSQPVVETRPGAVRIESRGGADAGAAFLGFCLFPVGWQGYIEALVVPELAPGSRVVRFRVIDSKLLDRDREEAKVSGTVWEWVKQYVHPLLEELHVDIGGPVHELSDLLPLFLAPADAERTRRLLDSVRVASVASSDAGLRVAVTFDLDETLVPAAATPGPGASPEPEPPLSEAEIVAFVSALHQFDAFLTFVVKQTGAETSLAEVRSSLLEVLLAERYDLVDALASPQRSAADPVRKLFLATWERLAPVLRRLAPTLPAAQAVRYLTFVSAGDALHALDEVGPAAGLDISADGLRRLARIIAPAAPGDPLAYPVDVDVELRALFGFGAPIEPAEDNPDLAPDDAAGAETATSAPGASAPALPAAGAPSAAPALPSPGAPAVAAGPPSPGPAAARAPLPSPGLPLAPAPPPPTPGTPAASAAPIASPGGTATAGGGASLSFLTPLPIATPTPSAVATAVSPSPGALATPSTRSPAEEAAAPPDRSAGVAWLGLSRALRDVLASLRGAVIDVSVAEASADTGVSEDTVRRLNRWAPSRDDIDEYLPLVRDLLASVARERIAKDGFDARFQALFRSLVPAAAWQESCWRQFVERGGKLVAMRSPLGSIGIMQVNQSVWRGFYDVDGLRRDIRYNARAGAEILSKYVRQYVAPDARPGSDDVDLAAWTYAVYNGGPGQMRRYQKGKMGKRERAVDRSFRDKFERTRGGDLLAVRECWEG